MLARSSLAFVVALGVTGCGAPYSYPPANSPRVSVVWGPEGSKFYKNGKKYDYLVDAVADNPRALEEARTAHTHAMWGGWLFLGGGLGLNLTGNSLGLAGVLGNDKPLAWAGWATALAGLCVAFVGNMEGGVAAQHSLNAINIYNDDVDAKMFIRRPAPAPTGTPATPSPAPR